MKSNIILFGALFALACVVSADVAENDGAQPASEAPVQKIHVLNPGEREYLSPNLIGVQNIAVSNIPLTMNFINIIDAHREVVDGVRYEIVLNAVNTTDNNTEVVCHLVVLEKPWLTTFWGDKVRLLQESNCTNEELPDSPRDRKSLEEKYETNALFTGTRNELTTDDMANLESQILTSSNPQMTRQRKSTTTTESTDIVQPEQVTASEVVTDSSPSTNTEEKASDTTADEPIVLSSESESTTTEKITPLNDDEKKWLDDFLSVGAFNFETSKQQNEASSANGETQLGDQQQQEEASQIERKPLRKVGGARQLSEDELKAEESKISASLSKIASGDGPSYTISKIFSGTKQVVAGTLVQIDAELIDGSSGAKERCLVSLWSRPWVKVDGYQVTFECENKEKIIQRHSRSVEHAQKKTHKKNHRSLNKAEHLFQKFQTKYQKQYHNTMERQMRLRIFKHNLKLIQDLNKHEMGSAKYGITEFADMTTTEYRERTGLMPRGDSNAVRSQAAIPDVELPKEFDWREKGVISQVKNQGSCGSCWAFSVTGNIEGIHAVKTGKLEEYSEQELLDCDTIDSACQGGLPDNAYQAIEKIGGLELESEYPYEAKKRPCHFNSTLSRVKISGAVDLPKNETAIAQWLIANGPISIGINANAMQFYRGGVSHPWKLLCSKSNLDHGVLIVGYGVSDYPMFKKTLPYWIVKNSWGPKWGEQGYYRVYRGDNTCGVSEMATSAILA